MSAAGTFAAFSLNSTEVAYCTNVATKSPESTTIGGDQQSPPSSVDINATHSVLRGKSPEPEVANLYPWPKGADLEYECISSSGSGSFAQVYKARKRSTGDLVAVKVMAGDKWALQEAAILRALDHENICKLYDWFACDDEGVACLVMQYASGGDLLDKIVSTGPLTEKDAADIAQQILLALQHMHSKGVVHRDLKPENILYSSSVDGKPLLADFGVGKLMFDDEDFGPERRSQDPSENGAASCRTHTTFIGTIGYSAPELASEQGHSFAADVWSFGAVMYVLLCGYHPFDMGEDTQEVIQERVQRGEVLPMSGQDGKGWEHVSDDAKDFVRQCLVVKVEERATVEQCLAHPWLLKESQDVVQLSDAFVRLKVYQSSRRECRKLRRNMSVTRVKRKREGSTTSDDSAGSSCSTPVPCKAKKKGKGKGRGSWLLPPTMESAVCDGDTECVDATGRGTDGSDTAVQGADGEADAGYKSIIGCLGTLLSEGEVKENTMRSEIDAMRNGSDEILSGSGYGRANEEAIRSRSGGTLVREDVDSTLESSSEEGSTCATQLAGGVEKKGKKARDVECLDADENKVDVECLAADEVTVEDVECLTGANTVGSMNLSRSGRNVVGLPAPEDLTSDESRVKGDQDDESNSPAAVKAGDVRDSDSKMGGRAGQHCGAGLEFTGKSGSDRPAAGAALLAKRDRKRPVSRVWSPLRHDLFPGAPAPHLPDSAIFIRPKPVLKERRDRPITAVTSGTGRGGQGAAGGGSGGSGRGGVAARQERRVRGAAASAAGRGRQWVSRESDATSQSGDCEDGSCDDVSLLDYALSPPQPLLPSRGRGGTGLGGPRVAGFARGGGGTAAGREAAGAGVVGEAEATGGAGGRSSGQDEATYRGFRSSGQDEATYRGFRSSGQDEATYRGFRQLVIDTGDAEEAEADDDGPESCRDADGCAGRERKRPVPMGPRDGLVGDRAGRQVPGAGAWRHEHTPAGGGGDGRRERGRRRGAAHGRPRPAAAAEEHGGGGGGGGGGGRGGGGGGGGGGTSASETVGAEGGQDSSDSARSSCDSGRGWCRMSDSARSSCDSSKGGEGTSPPGPMDFRARADARFEAACRWRFRDKPADGGGAGGDGRREVSSRCEGSQALQIRVSTLSLEALPPAPPPPSADSPPRPKDSIAPVAAPTFLARACSPRENAPGGGGTLQARPMRVGCSIEPADGGDRCPQAAGRASCSPVAAGHRTVSLPAGADSAAGAAEGAREGGAGMCGPAAGDGALPGAEGEERPGGQRDGGDGQVGGQRDGREDQAGGEADGLGGEEADSEPEPDPSPEAPGRPGRTVEAVEEKGDVESASGEMGGCGHWAAAEVGDVDRVESEGDSQKRRRECMVDEPPAPPPAHKLHY